MSGVKELVEIMYNFPSPFEQRRSFSRKESRKSIEGQCSLYVVNSSKLQMNIGSHEEILASRGHNDLTVQRHLNMCEPDLKSIENFWQIRNGIKLSYPVVQMKVAFKKKCRTLGIR